MSRASVALALALALGGVSCSDDRAVIAITVSDDVCHVGAISVRPGRQRFTVSNDGTSPVDVSVLRAPNDTLVALAQNVGARTTARLAAKLEGGQYAITCTRPGGVQVRRALFVSGPDGMPGIGMPDADRVVDVYARDFRFENLEQLATFEGQVYGGEMVIFRLNNRGPSEHTFAVNAPDGRRLAIVPRTGVDARQQVTFVAPVGGIYTYLCVLRDHAERGMRGTFRVVVSEAEASPAPSPVTASS